MGVPSPIYPRMPRQLPYSLGFSRYFLSFNGGNCVRVLHSDNLHISDKLVIELLLRGGTQPDSWGKIIFKDALPSGFQVQVYGSGPDICLRLDTDTALNQIVGVITALDEVWHHIVYAIDTGVVRTYRDRTFITEESYDHGAGLANTEDLYIACRSLGTAHTVVDIAFVRIYDEELFTWLTNSGLSLDWFVQYNMLHYHNPVRRGLVLWLPFEEGTGLTAYDHSGMENHGSLLPEDDPPTWERVKMWELRVEVGL